MKVTVAYKTLVCVHNLVQEGHPACLVDAYRQKHLFTMIRDRWSQDKVAYAQITTQYSVYVMAKLDFHQDNKEWICDKEGNLDWDYFLERYPDGGDIEYVLKMVSRMSELLAEGGKTMQMIFTGISMDQRVSKYGVNACVAHPLVLLCTDTYTLYQTIVKLLRRAWTLYDDLSDSQLDWLEDRTDRYSKKAHPTLRKIYDECLGIKYVTSLCEVPSLDDEPVRFAPPKIRSKKKEPAAQPAQVVPQFDENKLRDIDMFANQNLSMQWTPFAAAPPPVMQAAPKLALDEEAAQRLLQAQREQQDTNALLQYLTDKIGREREIASGLFSSKDAQIDRWKTMAGMLSNENKDLSALLAQLLAENEELRRRIAEEKAQHRRFIRGILDRHVAATESIIAAAVKQHRAPEHMGNIAATGADVGNSVQQALQWARSLEASRDKPTDLVAAMSKGGGIPQVLLDNIKGATTALRDPQGQLLCDTAANVASHLSRLVRAAADGDATASKKILSELEAWLGTLATQAKRLTDEESYQQISGEEWSDSVNRIASMRQSLAARAEDAARRLRDAASQASGVQRSVAEACAAIAAASNGLVSGVLDNVDRRMHADTGRKFRRDMEWVEQLLKLCAAVAAAVDALVETAVKVCTSDNAALYDQLMVCAETLRSASLGLVDHLKTRYSDSASTERMSSAYRAVTAAIKALIDSVGAYRKAQQELAAYNKQQEGAFQEDRNAIVEKRALVHRLRAQAERKRRSTENLTSLLAK